MSVVDDEPRFVTCQECGHETGDAGTGVACEECGHAPMPSYDYPEYSLYHPNDGE